MSMIPDEDREVCMNCGAELDVTMDYYKVVKGGAVLCFICDPDAPEEPKE